MALNSGGNPSVVLGKKKTMAKHNPKEDKARKAKLAKKKASKKKK